MVTTVTRGIATGRTCSIRPNPEPLEIPMAKKPKKTTSPDDLVKPVSRQLEQSELEQVSGGKVVLQDFHFVKKMDKSSPQ